MSRSFADAARRCRIAPILTVIALAASPALAYYGVSSTEVILSFDGAVEFEKDGAPTLEDLKEGSKAYQAAREKVEEQVSYLVGWFQAPSFVETYKCATIGRPGSGGRQRQRVGCPGTMGESLAFDIKFTGVESAGGDFIRLKYKFSGPAVFRKRWFPLGQTKRKVALRMPKSPDRLFQGDLKEEPNRVRCLHDSHYTSEGDFFYFWDPEMQGCSLKTSPELYKGEGLFTKTQGPRTKIPIKVRWPNFGKLYGGNGNGNDFVISWFLGYADEEKIDPKRQRTNERDDSYRDFVRLKEPLKALGFRENAQETVSGFVLDEDGKILMSGRGQKKKGINHLQVWEKSGTWRGKPVKFKLRILLSDTSGGSDDPTFQLTFRKAVPVSDVLIYMGHSGLGGNLDLQLERLAGLEWNPEKYQVFLFNGCSGNAYFPRQYAAAKGKDGNGKMNLRILSSSLPTYFHNAFKNQVAFLTPFAKLDTPDWHTFVKSMDLSNPQSDNVLYGVNGEGDDDWTPQQR